MSCGIVTLSLLQQDKDREEKTLDIVNGVVELVETTCSCMFVGDNIVMKEFSCRSDENTVVFRGEIVYMSDGESTAGSLVVFISQWVQDGASIFVAGVRLDVDSTCPTELDSFNSEDCKAVITDDGETSGGLETIVGSIVGVIGILLVLLLIAVVVLVVVFIRRKKHRSFRLV